MFLSSHRYIACIHVTINYIQTVQLYLYQKYKDFNVQFQLFCVQFLRRISIYIEMMPLYYTFGKKNKKLWRSEMRGLR